MLTITVKTALTPAEKDALFGWGENLWDNDRYGLAWTGTDVHVVGVEAGVPVTHAGAYRHSLSHGGRTIVLGGLNGVITVPEARGKGYGGQVVAAAEDHMRRDMACDFGMLFCHPELVPFYGPRGWRAIDGPVTIDQPDGPRPSPHVVMVLPFRDDDWPEGPVDLGSYPW